jgi:uncharacterized protein YijF (DUF1287 family)
MIYIHFRKANMVKNIFYIVLLLTICAFSGENEKFIKSAQAQIGKTLTYNPEYKVLKYPMGDIDISKGVCTDVVVRAFRGLGIDLQELIYKDKQKNPKRYKGLYYTDKLDPNIDHRRVKNIQAYLTSRGYRAKGEFKPGDVIVWKLDGKDGKSFDHIGICSNQKNLDGEPLIIHNIGDGAKEEDVLKEFEIVDHFRVFSR